MNNYERISESILRAKIDNDDKAIISELFKSVPEGDLTAIADLFEKKPEWVTVFNENRKKKLQAKESQDSNLWEEILAEEKKCLEDLKYGLD